MEHLPAYISVVFGITTLLTVWFAWRATHKSTPFLGIIGGWTVVQSFVAYTGFYTVTHTMPPRMMLMLLPPLLLIIWVFATAKGRAFVDSLDLKMLTWLHVVRVPVEFTLLWLFLYGQVPQLMTFEGLNFDILSGLTAPAVAWFVIEKQRFSPKVALVWNFICLGLLFNIAFHGVLSVPFRFQQFAFEQPNVALLYFPFVLLPGLIVPLVLFSHLVAIRKLLRQLSHPQSRHLRASKIP